MFRDFSEPPPSAVPLFRRVASLAVMPALVYRAIRISLLILLAIFEGQDALSATD